VPVRQQRPRAVAAPRLAPSSRPKAAARAGRLRGWATLLVLVLIVGIASVGPGTIIEALRGLTFVRPSAASAPTSPLHADATLQTRLDAAAASLSHGSLAASIIDLRAGASASVDAERAYPAASLFKLPILAEVLAEEDAGLLDEDQLLEIRPEDWTDGSGVLQARVGDRLPVRELTRLMIQESDNIAALVLLDAVGFNHVNTTAERLGLRATHLVDHRQGESGDHTTSAGDVASLLRLIVAGELVDARVSEHALQLLELKQANSWLSEELPFWVKLAHKWGDLPTVRNDAGILFSPRGSVIVVVLTRDGDPDEVAQLIARTARLAYDFQGGA
jgi:beta-lactamase class A